MQVIQHQELSSAATEITFNSIPQTYTDLYLVVSARSTGTSNNYTGLKINGVNTNQSSRFLYGTGSGVGSVPLTGASDYNLIAYMTLSSDTANTFASSSFYIPNYTASVAKSVSIDAVTENNAIAANQMLMAGLWNSTAAITSLSVVSVAGSSLQASGNLAQYSSATLYGINRYASSAPKATGGIISYSGGYWYHTFTSSGTFAPTTNLTGVDYLVVAGGGGGGCLGSASSTYAGGGGGAGGYRAFTNQSISSGSYTVTVGAGGTKMERFVSGGTNGSNSSFNSTSATGGGKGGGGGVSGASEPGSSGGSGGGAAEYSTAYSGGSGNAGGYTPVEGYAGGSSLDLGGIWSGGGGGAGGAGGTRSAGPGATWLDGVTRAAGGDYIGATSALPATGSGGFGSSGTVGGAGGSGIVIVRYPA